MSKYTTTLHEIIVSELQNKGLNEFYNHNQITFFEDNFQFIKKILKFDDDVEEIVTRVFFNGYSIENEEIDYNFKRMFITRFANREINTQTVEAFSSIIIHIYLTQEQFIITLFTDLYKYINEETNNTSNDTGTNTSDVRALMSDLPQNEINLNVDDTVLKYGNNNTISRSKTQDNKLNRSNSNKYNFDNLLKSQYLFDDIFNNFDRRAFLQIG